MISENLKLTALINGFSLLKIPLLAACTPQVLDLTAERSVVRVRLDWRTRNHLGAMYFGALAMGAELSVALAAVDEIQKSKMRIDFLFKDFHASFLKRADHHVHFVCEQVGQVRALIEKAKSSNDRFEQEYNGYAFVPSRSEEPVMKYSVTLSVKNRSKPTAN